ncbi:MAG: Ppx/GppA family phosphatase [Nitrospinae bacterium]|nr:Ppx/GppA family phosphatase [Nitrospinota bacterium]
MKEEPKDGARYAASIDIGTNTVRFLVGDILPGGNFRQVHSGGAITRLGAGLKNSGRLSQDKINYTVSVLSEFRQEIDVYKPEFIAAVATSAAREASNGKELAALAREKTGLDLEIINWEEEARRTLLGVFWQTQASRDAETLIFDIGGGSTEFIISRGPELLNLYGTNLGVVHLAEEFVRSDPLNDGDLKRLQDAIREEVEKIKSHFGPHLPEQMICTAGTPTTLVAAYLKLYPYNPERVHNFRISREKISGTFDQLRALPIGQRKKLPWIEEGRADLILPGAQVILIAMDLFGFEEMIVSDYGLREGILLHGIRQNYSQRWNS